MNGNYYLGNELTRIYKKKDAYLTLVQKITPTGYVTIHTIFDNTFDFSLYPNIESCLSDQVSFGIYYQKNKERYKAFIEEEQFLDGHLHYERLWQENGTTMEEALILLEEKILLEKGRGRK